MLESGPTYTPPPPLVQIISTIPIITIYLQTVHVKLYALLGGGGGAHSSHPPLPPQNCSREQPPKPQKMVHPPPPHRGTNPAPCPLSPPDKLGSTMQCHTLPTMHQTLLVPRTMGPCTTACGCPAPLGPHNEIAKGGITCQSAHSCSKERQKNRASESNHGFGHRGPFFGGAINSLPLDFHPPWPLHAPLHFVPSVN